MLKDFVVFLKHGNALALAVGVLIGAAFGKIVTALTDDFINPILSLATGGADFKQNFTVLGHVPAGIDATRLEALQKAKVAVIAWGDFVSVLINFIIMAFVIFLLVKVANKIMKSEDAGPSDDILLLREIAANTKK